MASMGLFSRKPKTVPSVEWTESTIEAPLYPLEGHQAEREEQLSSDGVRLKHLWCTVKHTPHASGQNKGMPKIQVYVGQRLLGEIPFSKRAKLPELFDAVALRGVNVGTVRLARHDGSSGGTTAELTLGPHRYQPHRP